MDIKSLKQDSENFDLAIEFINQFIPKSKEMKFPAELGIERMRYFMDQLDNPQDKIKVIHVAGTSGKGSIVHLTAGTLASLGQKTGSHLSPFIEDFRERFSINGEYIKKEKFVNYLNQIKPAISKVLDKYNFLSYFELLTGLAFYIFFKVKVDYAVMETGLGGLYDATNVVNSKDKVCIISSIGFDHTEILGDTLPEIAFQKAGIIQEQNLVITLQQSQKVNQVFEEQAKKKNAELITLNENNWNNRKIENMKTTFDYKYQELKVSNLKLHVLGDYQAVNCSLALTSVYELSKRDQFKFNKRKIREFLRKTTFKARFEIRENNRQKIIIDSAHNPQKMNAFISNLSKVFPDQKFNFLVSIKAGKDIEKILKIIQPVCDELILTSFILEKQDMQRVSEDLNNLNKSAEKVGFENIKSFENPKEAVEYCKEKKEDFVITGSMYFIGSIYNKI